MVLVAGGIGISPFLAILSDVIHRLKQGKPCTPKNIMIVWAIKKSDELPLLSMINTDSIDPIFYDALNLDIQIYVTRETEPKLVGHPSIATPFILLLYFVSNHLNGTFCFLNRKKGMHLER